MPETNFWKSNPSYLIGNPPTIVERNYKKEKHVESWPVSVYNKKRDLICLFNPVTAIPTHKTYHNPYREKSWVECEKKQNFVNLGRDPFRKVRSLDYFARHELLRRGAFRNDKTKIIRLRFDG